MSRIINSDIIVGTPIARTAPNATLTSWRTASTRIDEENVAPEGLHRRNFVSHAVAKAIASGDAFTYQSGDYADITATSAEIVETNAGDFVVVGPFAYNSTDLSQWELFCSVEYKGDAWDPTATDPVEWTLQLGYSTDWNGSTGTWTLITKTERNVGMRATDIPCRGSISWDTNFNIALNDSVYFGLLVWGTDAVNIRIHHGSMYARQLKE